MKIAVVSDIHDNLWKLAPALTAIAHCNMMVCCGDLCSPFVLDQLARGFSGSIQIVFGNNDADTFRMTTRVSKYPHVRLRGEFFEDEFDGRKIAVNHFNNIALAIARAGQHDAVFYGHNHVHEIRRIGRTLAVNPGSIMGAQFDTEANRADVLPSFAIYDTGTEEAMGYEIDSELVVRAKQQVPL
jgi:uncharacterized protein